MQHVTGGLLSVHPPHPPPPPNTGVKMQKKKLQLTVLLREHSSMNQQIYAESWIPGCSGEHVLSLLGSLLPVSQLPGTHVG